MLNYAQLTAVACPSAAECWAAGSMSGDSLIERYDGDTWSALATPQLVAVQGGSLSGIECTGADDCWAAGSSGSGDTLQPLVVHYTAGAWAVVPTPHVNAVNGGSLAGVACVSASDCWAVGSNQSAWDLVGTPPPDTTPPLTYHYAGGSWQPASSPQVSTTGAELSAVACVPASGDCYAVGRAGAGGLAEIARTPETDGTRTGALEAVGGPAPGAPRPLPGNVTLRSRDGATFTSTAGSDGAFSLQVPAGSYTATGRSPLYQSGDVDCQALGPVTVTAGASSRMDVFCQES